MISPFVWSQALFLLVLTLACLFSIVVDAKVDSLFTSSVTYCSPPDAILIQEFSLIYYASNHSVAFNISAASVIPNLRVRANILLNVYGMQPVNATADFCQVFGAALCPLPTYDFIGSGFLAIPPSVDVASKIPGLAYKIPDLEAYAQLTLTDISTGSEAACIQATLSNGWSARQPAVAAVTGGIATLALLSSLLHSLPSSAPAYALPSLSPARFVDCVLLMQQIAATSLLHLNLPLVYRAFAQNFAWSLGLFPAAQPLQRAIDRMRRATGGHMQDGVESPLAYVNRRLSPYNAPAPPGTAPAASFRYAHAALVVARRGLEGRGATTESSAGAGPPPTVMDSAAEILPAGIPVYVNSLDIGTANAFMSVLLAVVLAVAVAGLLGVVCAVLTLSIKRVRGVKVGWADVIPAELRWFAVSSGIRLAMVTLYPVLIFTFLQWTLDDSWLSTLLSVVLMLCTALALLYPAVRTMRIASHGTEHTLYTTPAHLYTLGALYLPFRQPRFYFFLPFLAAALFKAMFISLAKTRGTTQAFALLLIESALLVLLCVQKPHRPGGGEALAIYLAATRVAVAALMFAFVESLHITAIPRVAVGFVIMVIFSSAVIVMAVNVLLNFGAGLLWQRHRDGSSLLRSSYGSIGTDGEKESLRKKSVSLLKTEFRTTTSTSFSHEIFAHSRNASQMNHDTIPAFTILGLGTSDHISSGEDPLQTHSRQASIASTAPQSTWGIAI